MIFVSTKAGYVDAELLRAAGQAEGAPDVADGPHCVHPRCLGASLGRSLRSLKLATVRRRGTRHCLCNLRMRSLAHAMLMCAWSASVDQDDMCPASSGVQLHGH